MDRFFVSVLLLASVIGPMTCANQDKPVVIPEPHQSTTTNKPPSTPTNVTTPTPTPTNVTTPITTSTTLPPPTTPPITTSTHSPPTNGTTPQPTTPPTSKATSTTPSPHSSTTPAPPSDRKFEAFSFIGGFALAIGLVAIGFLAWKLYISRRENVYHTL